MKITIVPGRFDKLRTGLTARGLACWLLLCGLLGQAGAEGIYTCIDSKGRHLTADRPIVECIDREQMELNASGTLKRKIGPSPTAQERAAQEAKAREAAAEANRLADEKKRSRALLTRYPDRATHDKERAAALATVDAAIVAARKSTEDLAAARKRLDSELEFYQDDPAKVPAKLKRQIDENEQHIQAQRRFIANQDSEKRRINAQFDEELRQLRPFWAQVAAPAAATAPAAAKR